MFDGYFEYFGLTGGMLLIIGVGLVVFLLVAVVLERRTKLLFPNREKPQSDDDFLSFDDEGEQDGIHG